MTMIIEDAGYDPVQIGVIQGRNTPLLEIYLKRLQNGEGWPKHQFVLKDGVLTAGFLRFASSIDDCASSFRGVKVERPYRGFGIAHQALETYFRLCEDAGLEHLFSSKQRKPSACFLLTRYGYVPVGDHPARRVDIMPSDDQKFNIRFHDEDYMRCFLGTRLFRGGDYRIAAESEDDPLACVQLQSGYRLEDLEIHDRQREMNNDSFTVYL